MQADNHQFRIDEATLALRFYAVFLTQVKSAGGERSDISALLDAEGVEVLEHMAQVAVKRRLGHFPPRVDVDATPEELLRFGRYNHTVSHFLELVQDQWSAGKRPSNKVAHLVSYPGGLSSQEVTRRMAANGLRPGTGLELLVYGAGYKDLPRKEHKGIAALGDTFRDEDGVWHPAITVNELGRSISGEHRSWEDPWLFLAYVS